MLRAALLRLIHDRHSSLPIIRCFHHEFTQPASKENPFKSKEKQEDEYAKSPVASQTGNLTGTLNQKYKIFKETESPEILDIYEERERYQKQDEPDDLLDDIYKGLNLKRGLTGVYDIDDLVDVLRKESAEDIFVCAVPKELKYIDYLVVCSGRSYRHMLAMAEFVRRVYKMKRKTGDILPKIEGEKSRDWMAMDLGNIALHIFSPVSRESYDLESLWAIGVEYDKESNKPKDPLVELFENNTALYSDGFKLQK